VEFIDLDEAWADLRRQGVVKVVDSPKELRLELDGDAAVVMDIATEDHPEVGDLPATIRRVPRGAVANFVEAIVHKMHLQQTYAIPVGRWREIFDAVSDGMASNAAWREVDTSASIEMNKRDPLVFGPANAHTLRDLVKTLLHTAKDSNHGLTLCSDGAPLVLEIMPRGEMVVFAGHGSLAKQCEELLAHAKVD
jgi:rhodanese-related sulfurtransferase